MTRATTKVVSASLSGLRRVAGRRDINWTPEFMGFGNQLYLWCWAFSGLGEKIRRKVLITPKMRYWADLVPNFAAEYLIERSDVSLLDRRGHYWADKQRWSGGYPQGFSRAQRADFIGALHDEPLLRDVLDSPLDAGDVLTVNVRRGDYYSVAAHRSWFAIDLDAYLHAAVTRSIEQDGPITRLHFVSDDEQWCRARPWSADLAPQVTYGAANDPADNFRDICAARRLVLSNSTFSLWGGFISSALHPSSGSSTIWAPAFFQSTYGAGRCFEYDEDWNFVDDLPDGWQPQWVLGGQDPPGSSGSRGG